MRQTLGLRYLFIAVAIAAVVYYRLTMLYEPQTPPPAVGQDGSCILEDDCLFRKARRLQLINPGVNQRLEILPIDALDTKKENAKVKTLKRLYFSEPGRIIKREVQRWNDSRTVAAIRHKRISESTPDKSLEDQPWEAFQLRRSGGSNKLRRFRVRTTSTVPEAFGFVHGNHLRTGYKQWDAAVGSTHVVAFRQALRVTQKQTMHIQFIGRFRGGLLTTGGQSRRLDKTDVTFSCDPRYITLRDPDCTEKKARAGSLHLNLEAVDYPSDATIEIHLASVHNDIKHVDGLRVKIDNNNRFTWRPLAPKIAEKKSTYQFYSAQPYHYPLLRKDGRVNACGEALGLVPVIGFDRSFAFSINGLFAQSRLPRDDFPVQLSIDARLQQHAHRVLTEAMTRPINDGEKTAHRKPSWFAKLQSSLKKSEDQLRRAALVVLDADSGDILATAGWPTVPPLDQVTSWDLRAYHKVYEKHGHISPLEIQAWQILNRDNTPGSIFKPIVAASAASAVTNGPPFLREYIAGIKASQWNSKMAEWDRHEGRLPPAYIGRPRYSDGAYTPVPGKKSIENFKHEPLSKYFRDGQLGLKQAIQFSSNLWFIKLEMIVDRSNAYAYDQKQKVWRKEYRNADTVTKKQIIENALQERPIILRRTMERFGFTKRLPFLNWRDYPNVGWPKADYVHTTLSAPPSSANVFNVKVMFDTHTEWPLAQTAIGQAGVQITPLHIATVVASIANNRLIKPKLFNRLGDQDVHLPTFQSLNILPEVLGYIHAGMKAVPEAGTASGAFHWSRHPDTEITYGKTGTAEVKVKIKKQLLQDTKSVWFVGWREPKPSGDKQRGETRRLAFACMVTHAGGTGGGTCAPIVAEFLRRINKPEPVDIPACQPPTAAQTP